MTFRLQPRRFGGMIFSIVVLTACLFTAFNAGAEREIRTAVARGPMTFTPEIADGKMDLTVEEAISIALERNLDLLLQRYDRETSFHAIQGNRSIYDLFLTASTSTSDSAAATASTLEASSFQQDTLNLGLSRLFETGGTLSASWNNSKSETDLVFSTLNPSYDSTLGLNFVQPLIRGFGREITERNIRIAQLNSRISREDFERQVQLVIQRVENAYWNLIDSRDQLKVSEEGLRLAKELHKRNKIEVEVGTRAPLELIQSEATIATRQEEIIRAQTTVGDRADELRRLLNLPQSMWTLELEPTSDPETLDLDIAVDEAIETAFGNRSEIRSQELAIDRGRVDSQFFLDQTKPRLDLNLGYGLDGTAGSADFTDPLTGERMVIDTGLTDAVEQLLDRDFDSWSVQLTFAYPLQNRRARADRLVADLDLERAEITLEDLKQGIAAEVRSAARQVTSAKQQIESALASQRLQEKNLDAEQKRYENGMSTSFQVTQIQEDLTEAQSRVVTAVTVYRIARAEYYRATGRLLQESGIEVLDDVREESTE